MMQETMTAPELKQAAPHACGDSAGQSGAAGPQGDPGMAPMNGIPGDQGAGQPSAQSVGGQFQGMTQNTGPGGAGIPPIQTAPRNGHNAQGGSQADGAGEAGCGCEDSAASLQTGYEDPQACNHSAASPSPAGPDPRAAMGPQVMAAGMAAFQGMPQGMAGPQGMPQGMPGPQGMAAPQGIPQGMPGPQGMAAPQGMPQGMPGPQGMAAPQGMPQGMPGPQGMAAPQGMPQGMPGPQGMAAPQGMPGPQGMPQGMAAPQGASQNMCGQQAMPQGSVNYQSAGPQVFGPGVAAPGYQQPQSPDHAAHTCEHGPSQGPGHPKHDAHQYGQLMGLVNDLANGSADPSKVMAFLGSLDTQFWKGALVGVSATLLLTNDTVKNTIVGTLAGVLGAFEKKEEPSE